MPISDPKLAAQLLLPGEEPQLFDDIGCLRDHLRELETPPKGWSAFVADHRTGAWTPARAAVYTLCPSLETPMGSHLVAFADDASRRSDPAARGGTGVPASDILPGAPP